MKTVRWAAIATTAALAAFATGCGQGRDDNESGSSGEGEKMQLAVFVPNGGDPYWQNKTYGYVRAAKDLGNVDLRLIDAGGYGGVEKQINQIDDAIQRQVDAMVINATDSKAICGPMERAMDAGIAVVADDIMPTCDFKVPLGVSENSTNVGRQECQYLAKAIGGKGGIVMLKGPAGAKLVIDRQAGCKEVLKKYPDIKILAEQWGPNDLASSQSLMDDFLQAHGENIDAAYTLGSVTGLGVVNSLKSAGYKPGDVKLLTIDYGDEIIKAIKAGWVDGVIPAEPVRLADITAKSAIALAQNKPVEGKTGEDECCEKRQYTAGEEPVLRDELDSFDASQAVAPPGFKPPLQG
jgi:ABC-type sugar transport system substrate-binding protein